MAKCVTFRLLGALSWCRLALHPGGGRVAFTLVPARGFQYGRVSPFLGAAEGIGRLDEPRSSTTGPCRVSHRFCGDRRSCARHILSPADDRGGRRSCISVVPSSRLAPGCVETA